MRVLFMFFVESTHAVALAISSFLGGLALSSLLFSRMTRHNTRSRSLICLMMLAAGLYGYFILANYQWIPEWLDAVHHGVHVAWLANSLHYAIIWFYAFLPAFFMGGAFPLINGLYLDSVDESARDTGTVYFWDTLGAIAGSLIGGFVLLPIMGTRLTAVVAAGMNILLAAGLVPRRLYAYPILCVFGIALFFEIRTHPPNPTLSRETAKAPAIDAAPRASAGIRPAPHPNVPLGRIYSPSIARPAAPIQNPVLPAVPTVVTPVALDLRFGGIVFQKESPYGQITVGAMPPKGTKRLFINYRAMCMPPAPSETLLAKTAMDMVGKDSEALNIGLGCGMTASALAFHEHTKSLDIVEINPVIPEATKQFTKENKDVLNAPHVSLHILNGADWLRTTNKKYDAIVIDIEEISVIYSSPLFSQEYFSIIRDRLKEGGMFALWAASVGPEFTRVMYNTLKSVFPYVAVQYHDHGVSTNYYAAMHPFAAVDPYPEGVTEKLQHFSEAVFKLDNAEINTLNNPALEKYYDINKLFNLPVSYTEKFVKPHPSGP
ncbi:MAG: fused MFS/spermidine synthase [Alphaproteobacteria bacterium]